MPQINEAFPDPYAMQRIGHTAYCQAYADQSAEREATRQDLLREANMAYHLQRLRKKYQRILFVCGISHYPRIMTLLSSTQAQPIGRQRRDGVILAHLQGRQPYGVYLLVKDRTRAIAADLETGEVVVLGQGDLALAMRASMSIPVVFAPREIEGRILVDGGISMNLPIEIVRSMGADIVIAGP